MAAAAKTFRQEAVEHHAAPEMMGRLLRITPRWLNMAYFAVLITAAGGVLFLFLAPAPEYAVGRGIVEIAGRADVRAIGSGVIEDVAVKPGATVVAGSPIAHIHDQLERAEHTELERQLDEQKRKLLENPEDRETRLRISQLAKEKKLVDVRSKSLAVAAPFAGKVSDVWVKEGSFVRVGETIATLEIAGEGAEIVALLPGWYRPLLRDGLRASVHIDGFSHEPLSATLTSVSKEVVGPGEAEKYLGAKVAGSVDVAGASVLVRLRLDRSELEADGLRHPMYSGMQVRVDVPVRIERLSDVFFPLKKELSHARR